jgi:galactokinase
MSTIDPLRAPTELVERAFRETFAATPRGVSRAPGRVNLIGGHVDYNQGLVLPAAVELEVAVAFAPRIDSRLRILSLELEQTVELDISELAPGSVDGWAAYPAGVAWAFGRAGYDVKGLDAVVAGNVPIGAGLSSSAAIEVAFALALRETTGLELPELELAKLGQHAENRFVGVACGIMDQATSACAREGSALLLDCRSLELRHAPLPSGLCIVVLDSGVKRELRASEYNARRRECEEAVTRLTEVDDEIESLRDVSPESLQSMLRHLRPPLDRRVRHVVGEIERVRLAAAALEQGEIERFGELMLASHRSLRDDYQVSIEELDALVELAVAAPGVVGGRMTGAGFGGCTVSLVRAASVDDFLSHVARGYEERFGRRPAAWVSGAAAGASLRRLM